MSDQERIDQLHADRSAAIESHEALISDLRARGLPTYMATNILEKLLADQDAVAADARMRPADA